MLPNMSLMDFYTTFSTEQACRDFLEQARWSDGIVCPKCGVIGKAYKFKDGRLFKCGACRQQFTVRIGTIFEDSKISLQKWLLAIYLSTSLKKGISSIQLAKYLKVRQATAWFMLSRIRHVVKSHSFELFDGYDNLTGEVEVDEAYVGGKDSNKHVSKRAKTLTGKSASGFGSKNSKTPVVGMVERHGRIRAIVTSDTGSKTLMTLIRKHIDIDATVYTDEHMPYRTLPKLGYAHLTVNHGVKEFVNGMAYTNTVESFWSHLKRGIDGIYHHVSPQHLQKYCDEYSYRWNTRNLTDGERFEGWFGMVEGKRLTYEALIKKA